MHGLLFHMVSLLCFRNSFLLLLTRRTLEKSSRNTAKLLRERWRDAAPKSRSPCCMCFSGGKTVHPRDLRRSQSREHSRQSLCTFSLERFVDTIRFWERADTARNADVSLVSLRLSVICLNLILLPFFGLSVSAKWGPLAARVWFILAESVFDRIFTVLGVYIQLTQSSFEDSIRHFLVLSRGGAWGQVATFGSVHLPVLLPAAYISLFTKTSLISLARIRGQAEFSRTKAGKSVISAIRRVLAQFAEIRSSEDDSALVAAEVTKRTMRHVESKEVWWRKTATMQRTCSSMLVPKD